MSYHRQSVLKCATGINLDDALVDSGEFHHRLGSPDHESE